MAVWFIISTVCHTTLTWLISECDFLVFFIFSPLLMCPLNTGIPKYSVCDSFKCYFFFFKILLVWTIFKLFIEFVKLLLWFYVLLFGHEACGILAP